MTDANTSAPAETGEFDLSALADSIPDDAFDLPEGSEEEHPEGGAESGAEGPADPEGGEPAEPAEHEETTQPGQEEAEPAPEAPQTVTIGGKAIRLDEVERGYLRQDDYTRKTQELARERHGFTAERETLTKERTQLDTDRSTLTGLFDVATDVLKAYLPARPDRALIDTDIIEYTRQERAHEAAMNELGKLVDARKALDAEGARKQEEASAAAAKAASETFAEELRLVQQTVPELATQDGAKAFFQKAEAYVSNHRIKPEELHGLQDPRFLPILSDAMKWKALQDKKPAAVARAKAAPPIRPAVRQAPGTRNADQVRSARERLQREGSIEAAAALVDDSLFD